MLPWSILVVSRAVDLILVLLVEELHADNSEDEENDDKNEDEITQRSHSIDNNFHQHVKRWPRLCQLHYSHETECSEC